MTNQQVYQNNQSVLSQVNSSLAKAAWKIIEIAQQQGYTLIVAEGYRSVQKQNDYYAQGRTKPGKIITFKKGGESKHNTGEAVDFDFIINSKQSNSNNNNWKVIGDAAKQVGLVWGGDWRMKDLGHVEMPKGYSVADANNNDSSLPAPNHSGNSTQIQIVVAALLLFLILD